MLTLASSSSGPPRSRASARAGWGLGAFLASLAFGLGCASGPPAQAPPPVAAPAPPEPTGPPRLAAGLAVEGTSKVGAPALYRVETGAGSLLDLEIDAPPPLTLRLLDSGGAEVGRREIRAPGWPPGRLLLLTPAASPEGAGEISWTVEVSLPGAGPEAPFRLTVRALRPAETGDAERLEAEKALAEAERLAGSEEPASLQQALERLRGAQSAWERSGDEEGQGRALAAQAALQIRLGAPAEAGALARKAAELVPGAGGDGEARALTLQGTAALEAGDLEAARPPLERALPLWRALRIPGSTASAAGLGRTLLALGEAETGANPGRAEAHLKEAAEALRQGGDGEGEARALAALQRPLAALGRAEEGERQLLEALRRSRAGGHRAAESTIQARLAALRRGRGDLRGAQVSYRRTFELERDLGRSRSAASALVELCAVQRDLDDDEAARACYAQASEEGRRLGARGLEAASLAEQAEVALRQGRPKDAMTLLGRLAPLLPTLPPEEGGALPARALLDAGIAKRNAGRPKEALADLEGALDLLAARGAPPAATSQAQIQLGATRQRLGDLDGAEAAYRQASGLAERGGGLEGEWRRSLYGLATVAFARKDLPGARARIGEVLALDPKAGAIAPWERTLNPPDAGRHAFYELEVELLMRLHFEEPGGGYSEMAFRTALAARGLEAGQAAPPLSEIAARLTEPQALLHYFVGQERSYLFVVTRLGLKSFEVPIRGRELAAKIQRLRSTLAQPQTTPRPFLMDAVPLFEILLGPAEGFLAGKRQLIVSGEGPLLTLPFEALPTDAKASRDRGFADLPYLLRDRAVSYRPAYGLLPPAPRPEGEAGPAFLAFAAPLPKGIEAPPARYREEVEEIAGRYSAGGRGGVEIYLGIEATEPKAVANPRFATARRLHLAVPALFDSWQPERSALALTPVDASDEGWLEAAEIAGLHLAAETVVLPLCRTVRGREVGGEGGVALASAFRRAGAGTVLLGLWTVPDAAGSNLLSRFYQGLDAGEAPAEALRAAKLSLLQAGGADPTSWAPFLLFD